MHRCTGQRSCLDDVMGGERMSDDGVLDGSVRPELVQVRLRLLKRLKWMRLLSEAETGTFAVVVV